MKGKNYRCNKHTDVRSTEEYDVSLVPVYKYVFNICTNTSCKLWITLVFFVDSVHTVFSCFQHNFLNTLVTLVISVSTRPVSTQLVNQWWINLAVRWSLKTHQKSHWKVAMDLNSAIHMSGLSATWTQSHGLC